MSNVEIVLNDEGFIDLLKSEEIKEVLLENAQHIKGKCHGDYTIRTKELKTRNIALVESADERTAWQNFHHKDLLKAIGNA